MKWELIQAVHQIRQWEEMAKIHGLHLGLCGSVLHRGHSDKDLDVVVFPLGTDRVKSWLSFTFALKSVGFTDFEDRNHEAYGDNKVVIRSHVNGLRVDWFLFNLDKTK